jgi:hypothetical protein
MVWCLVGIVSVYDDTPYEMATLRVKEVRGTVLACELSTISGGAVGVATLKRSDSARDHPLAPEDHLVHILLGASHTCLIDEGCCLLKAVRACEGLKASQTLLEDCLVRNGHVQCYAVQTVAIDAT